MLDQAGKTIPGFEAAQCEPVSGDQTRHAVQWKGASIGALANQAVRFKFVLDRARLFSFWVSPSTRGESRGYLGAGGPGFTGTIDA